MKCFFIIIGVLVILFVVKMVFSFIHETRQLNQSIREEGGMRCVCSTLVDGLLAYRGARVVKEDSNSILKSASNLNGNLNRSKELEHYAS